MVRRRRQVRNRPVVIPTHLLLLQRRGRLPLAISRPTLPERQGEPRAGGIDDEAQQVEPPEQDASRAQEQLAQAAVLVPGVQPRLEVSVGLDAVHDRYEPEHSQKHVSDIAAHSHQHRK
ncbi:hypothetical protein PG994_001299 [Apiospora phragmitis]|uniref:Uncharacterized protein n=1 Tax=Apiospora phragmitis TaxID=2905665 RepID=A0ABR1WT50_9PEZI